jgi:hypothetical protein
MTRGDRQRLEEVDNPVVHIRVPKMRLEYDIPLPIKKQLSELRAVFAQLKPIN